MPVSSSRSLAVLLAAPALAAAALPLAAPARAASPWHRLSAGYVNTSYGPSVVRTGSGELLVAWTETVAGAGSTLHTRLVSARAVPDAQGGTGPTWSDLGADPAAFLLAGTPAVAVSGNQDLASTNPRNGVVSLLTAADGRSWALQPGALSVSQDAAGDSGLSALDDGTGSPVVAFTRSDGAAVTLHHGYDGALPTAVPDTSGPATGTAEDAALVRDAAGRVWAGWYDGTSGSGQGVYTQEVLPEVGPLRHLASSVYQEGGAPSSTQPDPRVPLAARVGGGVWTAYAGAGGRTLVLAQVDGTRQLTLRRSARVQYAGVSPAPGGRLWVWWVEGGSVWATRTDPGVTRFGALVHRAGPDTPTRTAGDGGVGVAYGPLDLVVNAGNAVWSTRLLAGLQVAVRPVSVPAAGGSVVVSVTDAGTPVAHARVAVGGVHGTTSSAGTVTLRVPRGKAGRRTVTAQVTGSASGSASLRVR
ncbi:hypothetical protein EV189_0600 [Motilibacter rhizosphaerae]|uniref:Ig-like domain-containing protein n=1 Tax=Motilibacter rhizosphaerae TaxID=598652 RepID=A0A4Q7NWH0_9ACTN|nr:hypothetical protein [Motilibacter rhizosphaerae]RZS91360.1 hypothetical protein EV189_0600 [Motilibacter rhizosphaerae]